MSLIEVYPYVVVGIVISFILPILRKHVPPPPTDRTVQLVGVARAYDFLKRAWPTVKPYVAILVFSLVSSVLIVAYVGDTLTDWRAALLAGFSWDSLMQKIGHS
jgi:xanthosine utilization system XapX-like protein